MRRLPLVLLLGASACSTSTGGELVNLTGQVTPVADVGTFQVGDWTVELDAADLAVGPVYLWSDRASLASGDWASLLVPTPVARATDPYDAGRIVGELPHQVRVDLLDPTPVSLGEGTGVSGPAGSAEIWLEPADDGPTLHVAGTATRGPEVLPFAADITWQHPWVEDNTARNAILIRRVRGLILDATLDGDATVDVGVDPRAWFSAEALDALPDVTPNEDGVRIPGPEDTTGRGIDQGARQLVDGPWDVRLR